MAGITLISETSLGSDKTSTKAAILGAANQTTCFQIEWENATGTLDGTIDIQFSLTASADPTSNSTEQFTLNTASGSDILTFEQSHLRYVRVVYTKNNCTSIDLIVTYSDKLGGI